MSGAFTGGKLGETINTRRIRGIRELEFDWDGVAIGESLPVEFNLSKFVRINFSDLPATKNRHRDLFERSDLIDAGDWISDGVEPQWMKFDHGTGTGR